MSRLRRLPQDARQAEKPPMLRCSISHRVNGCKDFRIGSTFALIPITMEPAMDTQDDTIQSRPALALSRLTAPMCVLALLAGCASPPPVQQIDRAVFAGDQEPQVTSTQAFTGELQNLAASESLVVARASDGTGALSQPSAAEMIVVEPILAENRNNPDLALRRCDRDADGILDRHCPELFAAMNQGDVANYQFVSFESRYTINSDPESDRDYWGTRQTLNTADAVSRQMPVTLKLLTINQGNKPFSGSVDIYINIPEGVDLGSLRLASKVKSRAGAKAAVNTGLMVLSVLAGGVAMPMTAADSFFDDYAPVESEAVFTTREITRDRLVLTVSNIDIEPSQGVTVEYDAIYTVVD